MGEVRLGDTIDDFCVKCKRITNHAVVSLMNSAAAKVRCRTCYSDHDYRNEIAPPSKRDLKKAALFNQVLSSVAPAGDPLPVDSAPAPEEKPARKKH
jgi:hypothetical protein